jgi:phosphotransferase system  glucose/maltose/N-acetylglucosamine-specific IIC component
MRVAVIVMAVAGLIVGVYNAITLIASGSRFLGAWGLVFGIAVPILAIAQAWYEARKETGLRLAAATLSGVVLVEGAMLPLAENLRECRADSATSNQ